MKRPVEIVLFNSLDARYGSTYRFRALRDVLRREGFTLRYIEGQGAKLGRILTGISVGLMRGQLLFTQK